MHIILIYNGIWKKIRTKEYEYIIYNSYILEIGEQKLNNLGDR